MPDESTAVTSLEEVDAAVGASDDSLSLPCLGCGLRNPGSRRSCLACGAPLGGEDDVAGPLPVDPPLLERDAETRVLDDVILQFTSGQECRSVLIAAPRGTGTTRLLRHAAERLLTLGLVRILTTTVREADGPYAPVTRLLWERFGVTPAKGVQAARSEIVAEVHRVLGSRSTPQSEHSRRIIVAAGLPSDGGGRFDGDTELAIPGLAESVARFLAADAETTPIALLVDNIDAATDDGIALLRAVAGGLSRTPVLLVMAGEPAVAPRLGDMPRVEITPRPLSSDACAALCRHLLPGLPEVRDELLAAVVSRSAGAPGRVREILLALIESRVIVADDVPWRIDLDALGPHGPVSTGDLITVRLGRLDAEARAVLDRAAIVGEVFWEGAVVAMTRTEDGPGDPFGPDAVHSRVREALRRLAHVELIAPIEESELALEREYAFAVAGLREVILRQQPEPVRAPRHDICASWLELAAGPRADELARAIASHLERAGLREAAARSYLRAARAARASYRGPQAVQLFDKALGFLPRGDAPARIDALHDKGVVLSLLGRVDEATAAFREMLDLAHRFGARNKMAAALGRLGRLARGRGEIPEARELLYRALDLFRLADDHRGIAAVQDDLGILAFLSGDFDAAITHSTQALEIRREMEDLLGEALSTHNLGLVHLARGQPRQARAHFERALALREAHGDAEGALLTRNAIAVLAYERGDVDQAEQIWGELLELSQGLGDKRMIVCALHNLGEAAINRGDATRASQLLDGAEQVANEIDDRRAIAEVERSRGALARTAGDSERARVHLQRSLAIAQALGVREAAALALRGLGEVCAMTVFDHSGQLAQQAEQYFTEAVTILEALGATRELARTRAVFGAYLLERGESVAGRKMLTLAVPVLERLELAEAARARNTLDSAGGEMVLPDR